MEIELLKMLGAVLLGIVVNVHTDSYIKGGVVAAAMYWLSL